MSSSAKLVNVIYGSVRLLFLAGLTITSCRVDEVQPGTIDYLSFQISASDSAIGVSGLNETPMVKIEGGTYIPIYGSDSNAVQVQDFMMDVFPVTNEQFLQFVKHNPQWRKSQVKELFGDANYLSQWKNDTTLAEDMLLRAPVTNVSWYAATAYCDWIGKRLPTVDEWEYAGMASADRQDARGDEDFTNDILHWYETPGTYRNEVGENKANFWGLHDMHGLVWEWTADFNSVLISGDTRKSSSGEKNLFCGGTSLNASDLRNYAAFMRYAYRGSLKANYSVRNLGFRCATDIVKTN